MSLYRYLLYISYIGKSFRGAQRQVKGGTPRPDDPNTIQGRLEMGLKQLNPCNEPIVYLSSRTDAGVHALNTTCHVDLYRRNGLIYTPHTVTICLNKYFKKEDTPIRVLRTYLVPNEFHCRHNALLRTYLYRIIVSKIDNINKAPLYQHFPIEELDRSMFYCTNTFDIDAMREAAQVLEGHHDFRTFMGQHFGHEEKITRKIIKKIDIVETNKYGYSSFSWPTCMPYCSEYKFLDIYVQSKGFLYKQVRRTVAALVAVAQGKVTIRDIKFMLEVPSPQSWCPQLQTVPAHGLYLSEVQYSQEDIGKFRETIDN